MSDLTPKRSKKAKIALKKEEKGKYYYSGFAYNSINIQSIALNFRHDVRI